MAVLIVGSIALDSIKTQVEEHADILGGSASYASLAASFFGPVNLVGIVGSDFPAEHIDLFRSKQIDLQGLQTANGKTFRWSGEYDHDMNKRQTLHVELNVFETFSPKLPDAYLKPSVVLLGNISPSLQYHVLEQSKDPHFIIADTMDLWISLTRADLLKLLQRIDLLVLNDSEIRQLVEDDNVVRAARKLLALGPKYVAVKKGEHGCLLFSATEFFSCGAFPLEEIKDPTGAGDSFAGGFAGYLAGLNQSKFSFGDLKKAVLHGTILASFTVEEFGLDRLKRLDRKELDARYELFDRMLQVG